MGCQSGEARFLSHHSQPILGCRWCLLHITNGLPEELARFTNDGLGEQFGFVVRNSQQAPCGVELEVFVGGQDAIGDDAADQEREFVDSCALSRRLAESESPALPPSSVPIRGSVGGKTIEHTL